jgi:hypothetical protein
MTVNAVQVWLQMSVNNKSTLSQLLTGKMNGCEVDDV